MSHVLLCSGPRQEKLPALKDKRKVTSSTQQGKTGLYVARVTKFPLRILLFKFSDSLRHVQK
jgi:hypothetical protein